MIYLGFFFDYLIMMFLPINSYFVINDIDKNSFLSVIFIGILLDIMYFKLFINVFILVIFYIVLKIVNVKKKYNLIKNIVLYILYFNVMYFMFGNNGNYLLMISMGFILQLIYIKLAKVLLK